MYFLSLSPTQMLLMALRFFSFMKALIAIVFTVTYE